MNFNINITGQLNFKSNPEWPPTLSSIIVVQHPNHKNNLFICQVQKYLSESQVLLDLLNNKSFLEHTLNQKSVMILNRDYAWKYINMDKFNKALGNVDEECKECKDNPANDTSLLTTKGEIIYKDLFGETNINTNVYDSKHKFTPLDKSSKQKLLETLGLNEEICVEDRIIVTNKNIAIRNIIDTKEDEIGEGNKIIAYLKGLLPKQFDDLSFTVFNGYVHITRRGLNANDIITEKLVPDLKYFKWQYGLPIDYDALKYLLFQNKFQHGIEQNVKEQQDAERIFSQEYLVSLQPEPQYQMWTLKRLLKMWYADDILEKNIRKIKILINQWRARGDKNFNVVNGVLPSIVIYPRYGKKSAKIVLEKVAHYFLLYQNISWQQSQPSYFIKVNNLVWYTNGNLDLKLYFKKVLKDFKGTSVNSSFDSYMNELLVSNKLMVQL
jgi:hypothetical protein